MSASMVDHQRDHRYVISRKVNLDSYLFLLHYRHATGKANNGLATRVDIEPITLEIAGCE